MDTFLTNELPDIQDRVPAKISGIDHLTLPVRDLEVAERFYTQVLGAKVVDLLRKSRAEVKIDKNLTDRT